LRFSTVLGNFTHIFLQKLLFWTTKIYIKGMTSRKKTFPSLAWSAILSLAFVSGAWADNESADLTKPVKDVEIFRPEKRETRVELVDSSKSNSVMLNVDIFGSLDVQSYYILWDHVDLSEDMKKLMTTRDFARDEFFMQNIDREQFEQERMLQLFEDKKREFFVIFPEEALKELQEKQEEEN